VVVKITPVTVLTSNFRREGKERGEEGKRKEKGWGQRRAPQSIWALKAVMNGNEEDTNMHIMHI